MYARCPGGSAEPPSRAAGIRPIWFNRFGAASSDDSVTQIWSLVPTEMVLSVIFDESKSPPATP